VSVTYLAATAPTAAGPPRVAFAVPRKVGTAVVRNRLRRQVRAHLGRHDVVGAGLEPGAYLVALRPGAAETSRDELLTDLDRCLQRLSGASR
jgi:ribonuclease P protein component